MRRTRIISEETLITGRVRRQILTEELDRFSIGLGVMALLGLSMAVYCIFRLTPFGTFGWFVQMIAVGVGLWNTQRCFSSVWRTVWLREEIIEYVDPKIDKGTLTWRCDACHQERPDEKISVMSWHLNGFPLAQRNFKYCNDKPECKAVAMERYEKGDM